MANPRKFSEKIALQLQKQAEETAAFEAILKDLPVPTTVTATNNQLTKPSLSNFKGGSLPNVNHGGVDIQSALHSLEGMKHMSSGRQSLYERFNRMSQDGQRIMPTSPQSGGGSPCRRAFPFDHRSSPYGSAYLSPPADSSWRRSSSESSLNHSGHPPNGHSLDTDQSNTLNGLNPLRPKSCEVPGINIVLSPEMDRPSIPINGNTGSLPDLTNINSAPIQPRPSIEGDGIVTNSYHQSLVDGTRRMALNCPRLLSPDQLMSGPSPTAAATTCTPPDSITSNVPTTTCSRTPPVSTSPGLNGSHHPPRHLQQQHSTPTVLLNGFNTHIVNHQCTNNGQYQMSNGVNAVPQNVSKTPSSPSSPISQQTSYSPSQSPGSCIVQQSRYDNYYIQKFENLMHQDQQTYHTPSPQMTHMAQISPAAPASVVTGGVIAPTNGQQAVGAPHSPSYQYNELQYMPSMYPAPATAATTTTAAAGVPTYPQPPSISSGYPAPVNPTYTQLPSPVSPASEQDSPMATKSLIPNIVFTDVDDSMKCQTNNTLSEVFEQFNDSGVDSGMSKGTAGLDIDFDGLLTGSLIANGDDTFRLDQL